MISIRFVRQVVFFSLMTILVSAFIQAQPPGGGRGSRGGFGGGRGRGNIDRATLLRAEQVRKELKIEEAQAATIDAALDAYRTERDSSRPEPDAFSRMSEEERTAFFEKSRKEVEELSRKTDEVLGALLEPEQTVRLDQISLQAKLYMAAVQTLKSDDLKSKLSLTDDQVAKLDEAETEMRASFQGGDGKQGGGGFEQMQKKMQAARKKSTDAAMAVLTDDQKKMIDEMSGPEFEIDMRAIMGGRGGFGESSGGGRQRSGGRGTRPPAE